MQKISEISTLFDANQDARNSTPYYILYREGSWKQSFVSMSSGRLAMQGSSSCRLGREQWMLDKAEGLANTSSEKSHVARHSRAVRVTIPSVGNRNNDNDDDNDDH